MATGACGIHCDICRLNLLGLCTTCGSGLSDEARVKLDAQERILGHTCPVLSCCTMNQNAHCMRDCAQFPCENYTLSTYPFGQAFLEMQTRRRQDWVPRTDPFGKPIEISPDLWDALDRRDKHLLSTLTLLEIDDQERLCLPFMDLDLIIDPMARQIFSNNSGQADLPLDIPLLTLTVLTYLTRVDRLYPMGKDLISTKDMDRGNYFSGRQQLKKEPLLRRFSDDKEGLARAALAVRGKPAQMADASWAFYPFPRLALYYLFWDLETDYPPRLSILFDRSIQDIFTPPMVWELVNLANARLLCA